MLEAAVPHACGAAHFSPVSAIVRMSGMLRLLLLATSNMGFIFDGKNDMVKSNIAGKVVVMFMVVQIVSSKLQRKEENFF